MPFMAMWNVQWLQRNALPVVSHCLHVFKSSARKLQDVSLMSRYLMKHCHCERGGQEGRGGEVNLFSELKNIWGSQAWVQMKFSREPLSTVTWISWKKIRLNEKCRTVTTIWLRKKQNNELSVTNYPLALKFQVYFQGAEVKPSPKKETFSFKITWTIGSVGQRTSAAHGVRGGITVWQPDLKPRKSKNITLVCTKFSSRHSSRDLKEDSSNDLDKLEKQTWKEWGKIKQRQVRKA